MIRIEYRNIENISNIRREDIYRWCISILELRSRIGFDCTPSFRIHRCEAERLFASARNKGIACAKRIEIPLCLHLPCVFSAFPFYSRQANRSNRRALSACRSVCRIRMYVWGTKKLWAGGREDQCVMKDPLSFPPTHRRAFRGSHGRVTMNGRYYFIGDQAKSKIEKRTGRDERK